MSALTLVRLHVDKGRVVAAVQTMATMHDHGVEDEHVFDHIRLFFAFVAYAVERGDKTRAAVQLLGPEISVETRDTEQTLSDVESTSQVSTDLDVMPYDSKCKTRILGISRYCV